MKKIKRKIKQFLALWLKDELLEYIPYKDMYPSLRFLVQTLDFIQEGNVIRIESAFVISDNHMYEQNLEQAKRRMAAEIMKHIKVDTHQLIDPKYGYAWKIRMQLYVVRYI